MPALSYRLLAFVFAVTDQNSYKKIPMFNETHCGSESLYKQKRTLQCWIRASQQSRAYFLRFKNEKTF